LPPSADAAAPVAGESPQPAIEETEQRQEPEATHEHKTPAITDAIEQVNRVIEELKHSLDEMEEVLETLELAERQKIDDEREIQNLQRALRHLHRPRDNEQRH
jgi:predicted RNase H-like nuclease (RuvC/YqgF family)